MRMRRWSSLLAVTAIVAWPAAAQARTVSVGLSASTKTVHLHRGDKLVVTLTEVQDGGFKWHTVAAPTASVLKRLSTIYKPPHLAPGEVGGSGKRVVTYHATGAGRTRVLLGDFGPQSRTTPVTVFALTVVVS
jgi:predicted secreted protein